MAYSGKEISNPVTGQKIRFLQTAADTNGRLLEMESTYSAQSSEPAPHYHPYQHEDFEILEGELTVRMDGQLKTFKAGDRFHVSKNVVHSMWNSSAQQTRFNWKVAPAMETEYLLETGIGLARDGKTNKKGRPAILQAALVANRFNKEFRLAKPSYTKQRILFSLISPVAYLAGYRPLYKKYLD